MRTIDKKAYSEMYGPTVGDKVRLGDTELLIEVEIISETTKPPKCEPKGVPK